MLSLSHKLTLSGCIVSSTTPTSAPASRSTILDKWWLAVCSFALPTWLFLGHPSNVAFDDNPIRPHCFRRRTTSYVAVGHVKTRIVPRADDVVSIQGAFAERAAGVGASVVRGMQLAVQVIDRDRLVLDSHEQDIAGLELVSAKFVWRQLGRIFGGLGQRLKSF